MIGYLLAWFRERPSRVAVLIVAELIVILVVMVLVVEGAPLEQATDTPTPTVTPSVTAPAPSFFETAAVPTRVDDSVCPPWVPYGWGTVTPAAQWELLCSHCVDTLLTPGPSGTPGVPPTATPTVTGTPPTPGPSATPDQDDHFWVGDHNFGPHTFTIVDGGDTDRYDMFGIDRGDVVVGAVLEFEGLRAGDPYRLQRWSTGVGGYESLWPENATGDDMTGGSVENYCQVVDEYAGYTDTEICDLLGLGDYGQNGYGYNGDGVVPPAVPAHSVRMGASGGSGYPYSHTMSAAYLIYYGEHEYFPTPVATNTPEPTPSGTPGAGYCDAVVSDALDVVAFGWTGLSVGGESCLDIGPYDLPLGLGEIPWLAHICFVSWSLGSLVVFAITIGVDVVLAAMGAVMVIRLVT